MIGITGGIGSGKSTIAHELTQRGYTVYDCDREAKRIITENPEVRKAIIDLLGEEAFAGGTYDTAYVAQRVFENSSLREALNAIVHPAVEHDIRTKQPDFIESAILYESGLDRLCDKVIVIDAPEEIRIARTLNRNYDVRARIRAQKIPTGDLTINNDGKESIASLVDIITHWM
jgi:dephospho-CoA kinase